ncbi:MAG: GNAT family N-acetyltransferase [Bacteroidia bacterium]|nr:GNAT family N-acetyltransferase [Bacteroidia bacterium]
MKIKSLADTNLSDIVACLLEAFEGYFVKMPESIDYWEERFRGARVEYELSFGMFDEERLVGFIMNGIDTQEGALTAFNTGTGVIPAYRSQKVVDRIYQEALPHLAERGVQNCRLEVIQANDRAIRVYERIGFRKIKSLLSFRGDCKIGESSLSQKEVKLSSIEDLIRQKEQFYSWDFTYEAISKNETSFQCYLLDQYDNSYYIVKPEAKMLVHYELPEDAFAGLISKLSPLCENIRLVNVDASRVKLIDTLAELGFENYINQYEMIMDI